VDLREIEWDGMDWIGLCQDRDKWRALEDTVMQLQVPQILGNFLGGAQLECCSTPKLVCMQVFLRSVRRLLVTASVVPSSPILITLMKEAVTSSERSVLTTATWGNIS
jgi:hypothetical protein